MSMPLSPDTAFVGRVLQQLDDLRELSRDQAVKMDTVLRQTTGLVARVEALEEARRTAPARAIALASIVASVATMVLSQLLTMALKVH